MTVLQFFYAVFDWQPISVADLVAEKEVKKMSKRKNIRQQLRNALHDQRRAGTGRSRHEDKKMNNGQVIYDKIYSDLSLKTHLSRIEGFAAWLKSNHPEVRDLSDITKDIAGQYLIEQQSADKSAYTIGSDMLAINRVQMGAGNWSEPIKKSDYGLKNRNFGDLRNNNNNNRTESQIKQDEIMRYKYRDIIAYGQAFGLRRSELLPSGDTSNRKTVAGSHSLYEKNGKIYHVTTGKGGRLRAIECLATHHKYITDNYGEHIKPMPLYLQKNHYSRDDIAKFKLEHKQSEQFFSSVDRSLRIHVECRQYYANHKLTEIMQNREETYINEEKVKINGIEIPKTVADYIAYQLGHGPQRYDVLRRYIGR